MVSCYACSVFGICLSVWAIVQLNYSVFACKFYYRVGDTAVMKTIMGCCYTVESSTMLEDVEPHEYPDFDAFIAMTKHNFKAVGSNCFCVAYIYIWIMFICIFFVLKTRLSSKKKAKKLADDDYYCNRPPKKKCCQRKKVIK